MKEFYQVYEVRDYMGCATTAGVASYEKLADAEEHANRVRNGCRPVILRMTAYTTRVGDSLVTMYQPFVVEDYHHAVGAVREHIVPADVDRGTRM